MLKTYSGLGELSGWIIQDDWTIGTLGVEDCNSHNISPSVGYVAVRGEEKMDRARGNKTFMSGLPSLPIPWPAGPQCMYL